MVTSSCNFENVSNGEHTVMGLPAFVGIEYAEPELKRAETSRARNPEGWKGSFGEAEFERGSRELCI